MADPRSVTDPRSGSDPVAELTDTPEERFNRRLGLSLFFVYLAFYALFVGLTVYDYKLMGREAFAGLNLAIVYGFGLIVAAFVLALVYMVACKKESESPIHTDGHR
jgi:uncharacterized membrane protein (DUF485 family)